MPFAAEGVGGKCFLSVQTLNFGSYPSPCVGKLSCYDRAGVAGGVAVPFSGRWLL